MARSARRGIQGRLAGRPGPKLKPQTERKRDSVFNNWKDILTEEEIAALKTSGFGRRIGPGAKPVLLIIDAQYGYVGESNRLLESVKRYPASCGAHSSKAIGRIRVLLREFRSAGLPVIYTTKQPSVKSVDTRDKKSLEIIKELKPIGEAVVQKYAASAFHGTHLLQLINQKGVDTVVVVGGTTSGCVRASVVDAYGYGYRVLVVSDAVFDRIAISERVALLDMWLKYADLVTAKDILDYLGPLGRRNSRHNQTTQEELPTMSK